MKYNIDILKFVKENYYYDNGFLYNKKTNKSVGHIKNKPNEKQRRYILLHKKPYVVARIIYMLCNDVILNDGDRIDHIDQNPLNDNIENLRLCNITNNNRNVFFNKKNKVGLKGVKYSNCGNKFVSTIQVNKKRIYLGTFENIIEAGRAYIEASLKYHGEYSIYSESNLSNFVKHIKTDINMDNIDEELRVVLENITEDNIKNSKLFVGIY